MLVAPESPLRSLPSDAPLRFVLYIDAVRISIETADLAYSRLTDNLLEVSEKTRAGERPHRLLSAVVLDAWSLVDSSNRLRSILLRQMPGLKKKTPAVQIFDRKTREFETLRHFIQHIQRDMPNLREKLQPVWGQLEWYSATEPGKGVGEAWTFVTGAVLPTTLLGEIRDPRGTGVGVREVRLTAAGVTANLTDFMEVLPPIVGIFEDAVVKAQQRGAPHWPSDLLIFLGIETTPEE